MRIINLPKIEDYRGNLTFIEEENHIPFKIQRAYWIYDVPGGEYRGSHAFKKAEEFIVAISGSFDVILHNGREEMKFSLNRSYYGIYVENLIYRRLENFSTNSLGLVLTSTSFDEKDYIRNFDEYLTYINDNKVNNL